MEDLEAKGEAQIDIKVSVHTNNTWASQWIDRTLQTSIDFSNWGAPAWMRYHLADGICVMHRPTLGQDTHADATAASR